MTNKGRAAFALSVLFAINTMNFFDRQVLGAVGETIRDEWKLSDTALFSQNLSVERGTSNMHSLAETALRTKINSTMQMKAAFSVRNDTNVPEDKKNTDTQTSVTLVYSF